MQLHLALYDPSYYVASERNYWTWRSSSIPEQILGAIYYDCLIKQKPENVTSSDLFGGAILLQDWVVVYRFYNGGRDTHGRPGRYVILTGWIKRDEVDNSAPSNIFSSESFEKLAISPPPCPTPKPSSLDIDISDSLTPCNVLDVNEKYTFPENSTVEEALSSFFGLNNNLEQYELVIRKTDTEKELTIQKCFNNINNAKSNPDELFKPLLNSSDSNSGNSVNDIQSDSQLKDQKGKYPISSNNILQGLLIIVIAILLSLLVIQNHRIAIQKQKIIMLEQKIEILEMKNTSTQKKIENFEEIISKKAPSENNESL